MTCAIIANDIFIADLMLITMDVAANYRALQYFFVEVSSLPCLIRIRKGSFSPHTGED